MAFVQTNGNNCYSEHIRHVLQSHFLNLFLFFSPHVHGFFHLYFIPLLPQTKTGIALLYDEITENTYEIRLKLTKEVLTIQKQDVICVSGSDHSANVSASITL